MGHAGKVGDDDKNDNCEKLFPGLLCHTTKRAHESLKIVYVDYGVYTVKA